MGTLGTRFPVYTVPDHLLGQGISIITGNSTCSRLRVIPKQISIFVRDKAKMRAPEIVVLFNQGLEVNLVCQFEGQSDKLFILRAQC
jgi:hypothetical protein